MRTTSLDLPDDYELGQTIEFLYGFTPQPVAGSEDKLRFATPLGREWIATEIHLTQPDKHLLIEWSNDVDEKTVQEHVARILSLDIDASGFFELLAREPVLNDVVDLKLGIRPPLFWSPYEAAVWAIISQRIRMTQATKIKASLAVKYGTFHSPGVYSTPSPEVLLTIDQFLGLNDTKMERLKAVAKAALVGTLDPAALRSQSSQDALQTLESIPGIGPFSAALILVRGAGDPDVFPAGERRLLAAMRARYQLPEATTKELAEIGETWAPFRSWASFQLRAAAERLA